MIIQQIPPHGVEVTEEERDMPTLASLLRRGAARYPQVTDRLVDYVPGPGTAKGVCAFGAMWVGLTGELPTDTTRFHDVIAQITEKLDIPSPSFSVKVVNPACPFDSISLMNCLVELNDFWHWSFEQIAAWLDTKPWDEADAKEEETEEGEPKICRVV